MHKLRNLCIRPPQRQCVHGMIAEKHVKTCHAVHVCLSICLLQCGGSAVALTFKYITCSS
jgi:hypothetical protein